MQKIVSNIHFPSHTYKSHFEATDKYKGEQLNNDKCVGEKCRTFIVYLLHSNSKKSRINFALLSVVKATPWSLLLSVSQFDKLIQGSF